MIEKNLADKLTHIAVKQIEQGIKAKDKRMKLVSEIIDLYNNKVLQLDDDRINIPFPLMSGQINELLSKVDNPPTVHFNIPNRKVLSEKIDAAWVQESSSMKAGWNRKDRSEKKLALLSGRGISKIYSSSLKNNYKSHYDVVDFYSFVADPTKGHLEDGTYHGEMDIFKTKSYIKKMADLGFYDKNNVASLLSVENPQENTEISINKYNRLKSLEIDVAEGSFIGQEGNNLTEWVMKYQDDWFYLFFDPNTKIWLRAEEIGKVFGCKKTPYVSWAVDYDEYSFWTKGAGDDIYPTVEAIRLILNYTLESSKRRLRPMKIVEAGSLIDINQLQDYVPDNVILSQPGRNPNIITLETPEMTTSINLVQFLNNFLKEKTGVSGTGVDDKDTKVGVFYGQLQREADRIGIINKSYSESYAEKGYRFFWGLKDNLTGNKPVEMLGKAGFKMQELKKIELKDVGDVDDVIVSGGAREEEANAIKDRQQTDVLAQLTAKYGEYLNPNWVIKKSLRKVGFNDEDIKEALDKETGANTELLEEADEAIQDILEGKDPRPNRGANTAFVQRILDWERDNINFIKADDKIDTKQKALSDKLLAYAMRHLEAPDFIVQNNMIRSVQNTINQEMVTGKRGGIQLPQPSVQELRELVTQPFENPQGTPEGTAEASQIVSGSMQ